MENNFLKNRLLNILLWTFFCVPIVFADSSGTIDQNVSPIPQFISIWNTKIQGFSNPNQIKLPLSQNGTYDFDVEWGEGKTNHITRYDQQETIHTYKIPGEYTVTITGIIEGFGFDLSFTSLHEDNGKLVDVANWGPVKLHNNGFQFCGVGLIGFSANDVPDISNITNMQGMFANASKFNHDIGPWNVRNVTNMSGMFVDAKSFNQDIGSWDVSNVTDMSGMFCYADAFNQNIGSWDVSKVSDMSVMFREAYTFNQDIGSWDVSAVEDMNGMFLDAQSFNQDISSWDVSNVLDMSEMFEGAHSFKQDIGAWNISPNTDTYDMFKGAVAYNREYGNNY